jgi:hypothetical protein
MGSEQISRQQSAIVERQSNGTKQEIIKVEVEMSEENSATKLETRLNGNYAEGERRTNTARQAPE